MMIVEHGAFRENRIVTEKRGRVSRLQRKGRLHFHTVPELRRRIRRQKRTVQIARSPLIWLCL